MFQAFKYIDAKILHIQTDVECWASTSVGNGPPNPFQWWVYVHSNIHVWCRSLPFLTHSITCQFYFIRLWEEVSLRYLPVFFLSLISAYAAPLLQQWWPLQDYGGKGRLPWPWWQRGCDDHVNSHLATPAGIVVGSLEWAWDMDVLLSALLSSFT